MTFRKKHRFLSLDEEDDTDRVMAGTQFFVKYVGSTEASEDFHGSHDTQDTLTSFYGSLVKNFQTKAVCVLHLIIDLSGVMVYDKMGACVQRFGLCDIKDIVYCERNQNYKRYFILVGKEESDASIKAYVFICENKQQAKQIYRIFIQTFTIGAQINNNNNKHSSEQSVTVSKTPSSSEFEKKTQILTRTLKSLALGAEVKQSGASSKLKEYDSQIQGIHTITPDVMQRQDWHVVNRRQGQARSTSTTSFDDSFTELARSRSSSKLST